ncbi:MULTISPECIES: S41 family peptidase [Streptomyces]|uniref:S41 family peptidase n=1 Tax=Streptomyces TaxID=1883 RepID=UPI0004CCB518|nr:MULTISPECIES: S41 family peptidase [Streptomyces]KOT48395.1 peptidase S41 [Streptomyces rimosus subsp. rimosus]
MTAAYLRFPHLHAGLDLVTFTAEDDVWIAPLDGGRAWRLSADNRPVTRPRTSPDGTHVTWASTRTGVYEVFAAPLDGGPATQLTYWGGRATVCGWTPDGDIVALSAHAQPSPYRKWAYAVPLDAGPARRLPYGPVGDVAHGPDGRVLLRSAGMGGDAAAWKRYKGGTAGKLWIDRRGNGAFARCHEDLAGNIECPLWVGQRIAFLCDHEGTGALYSSRPDGTDLRRHTPLGGFYARHAATDGTRVVYMSAADLWLLEDLDGAVPRRLDIRLGGQRTDLTPRPVTAEHHLSAVSPDHTGCGSAVTVRGTIHWLTHRDGPARALAAQPGVRARLPRSFRLDGQDHVVWVSDADGADALEIAPATGLEDGTPPRRLGSGELGRVLGLAVTPDGSQAAVSAHDGRVLLVDLASGIVHELDRSNSGHVTGLTFSPDSAWLAWSHPGPIPLRHLKLAHTADLSVHDATPLRFRDYSPAFTPDGKYLAFLSERSFDPVYDAHVFDLAFIGACRPHLITLAATTPSPFGPRRAGRPVEPEEEDTAQDNGSAPVTAVDLDGLSDRIIPVPVEAARYSALRAAKDGLLWLRHPLRGVLGTARATPDATGPKSTLERYDFDKLTCEEIGSDIDSFTVTGNGKRLLVRCDGKLRLVPADRRPSKDEDSDTNISVDLRRIRHVPDPAAEWRQMYDEAGRLMRDNYWHPDLGRPDRGGLDWDAVLDRYRPLLERIATYDELLDLLWEVQGELGTSHAYVSPPWGYNQATRQGLLGADLSRHEDGTWRIDRILPSETSDPDARSPLAAPGVAVHAGDAITAVGGRPVDPTTGPAPLLVGTAGQPVELTVRPAAGGDLRHPVVIPIAHERPLRYHAWVADRRAYVHAESGGRLGYLHVPDMVGSGWAQLHRDLHLEVAREGLILDVRENSGGHTSQLVVEKLARRVIAWTLPRGAQPYSYPRDAPRGPIVALANELSASDGDIITAAVKALGIGPVVGTRTWGGVIGIDKRYRLVDGTLVTQPKYATWIEGHEWGVENHGVAPDIEVIHTPQDHKAGRDPQIDEAIRLALAALHQNPAKSPPALPSPRDRS